MPLSAFASNSATIKISSNVTVKDIEVNDDVNFTYYVEINGQGYNGTAIGSDSKNYDVIDGMLTLPYNVSAEIQDVSDGSTYSVKRLAYDNKTYALIDETQAQFGEISTKEFYVSVDGETSRISSSEFNEATNYGANLEITNYVDADGNTYDESEVTTTTAYDSVRSESMGSTSYELQENEYTYVTDSYNKYPVTWTVDKSYSSKKMGITTYIFSADVTISIEGFDLPDDVVLTDSSSESNTTKSKARTSLVSDVAKSIKRLAYRVLTENINANTGLNAVLDSDVTTQLPDQSNWSDETETLTYTANAITFTGVEKKNYTYSSVDVEADKNISFDATIEPAPTGTLQVDFCIFDSLPQSCEDATFELKNALTGATLVEGEDYTLSTKNCDMNLMNVYKPGFTIYEFSDLAYGEYTIQQKTGVDGYATVSQAFPFGVDRAGNITWDEDVTKELGCTFKKSNVSGDNIALTTSTWSVLGLYTFNIFKNKTFSLEFTNSDQKEEAVEGSDFLLVERDTLVNLIVTAAKAGVSSIDGADISSILDAIVNTDWSNISLNTVLDLLVTVLTSTDVSIDELTIPAFLTATSGSDGVVSFSNSSNVLNILGYVVNAGISGEQLVEVLKTAFGSIIDDTYAEAFQKIIDTVDVINVRTGMPAADYILVQTSAPTGYERNGLVYTFTVNNNGTALISAGVILPVVADVINDEFGFDMKGIIPDEETFNEIKEDLRDDYLDFNEYSTAVMDGVINILGYILGEDATPEVLKDIRDTLVEYNDEYDNLADAVDATINDFRQVVNADVTVDWKFYNTRYFLDVAVNVVDCLGNNVAQSMTVTNSDGEEFEINDENIASLPYGTYTLTADVDEKYQLEEDSYVGEITIDNHEGKYAFNMVYHIWTDTVVEPTELESGYTLHQCSVSGDSYKSDIVDYKCEVDASGGSIRVGSDAGLRFGFSFDNTMDVEEYGFVYASGDTDQLSVDLVGTNGVMQLVAHNTINHGDYTTFNLVFTNVPTRAYDSNISARAYIKVDGKYYYSEVLVRNFRQVAQSALADEKVDEATKSAIEEMLA
jgi:hypothetical protein